MASPITKNADRVEESVARLPGWLESSTNFKNFIEVLSQPFQDIEDLLDSILNGYSIDTAVGVQLDVIGRILALERTSASETDTSYRARLFGRAAELSRSGEAEVLISVWKDIWTATKVYYSELYPAGFEVAAEVTTDPKNGALDAAAVASIRSAKAGGVGVSAMVSVTPVFLWGTVANVDASGNLPDSIHGFGSSGDVDGNGQLAPGDGGGNFSRALI